MQEETKVKGSEEKKSEDVTSHQTEGMQDGNPNAAQQASSSGNLHHHKA